MSVLVVGSLNVDLVTKMKKAPGPGETLAAIDFNMYPGGKGANQAVAIKRLGGNVTLAGALGNDSYGTFYHNVLVDEKMDERYIKRVEGRTGLAVIIVEENGENRIAIIHGTNFSFLANDVENLSIPLNEANICLTQLELPMETVEKFACLSKKASKTFILNPAPSVQLSDKLLKNISILTPNEHELGLIAGMDTTTDGQIEEAGRSLLKKGIGHLVITLGSRGALILDNEQKVFIPAYKVKPVDTTGAGDAFNGALAYCLDNNMSLKEAAEFANAVAALTVTKRGALVSLPRMKEVKKFLEK